MNGWRTDREDGARVDQIKRKFRPVSIGIQQALHVTVDLWEFGTACAHRGYIRTLSRRDGIEPGTVCEHRPPLEQLIHPGQMRTEVRQMRFVGRLMDNSDPITSHRSEGPLTTVTERANLFSFSFYSGRIRVYASLCSSVTLTTKLE